MVAANEEQKRKNMKTASVLVNIGMLGWLVVCSMVASSQQPATSPETKVNAAEAELRVITVDASSNLGQFKPLRGVNAGPLPWTMKLGADHTGGDVEVSDRTGFRSLAADASAGYRDANIELIRIHDNYGPGDIYANFKGSHEMADGTIAPDAARNALTMFPDIHADPRSAASYNFGPTDRLVKSIYDIGAHPLFRLGASAGESSGVPDAFTVDADYDHYAEIAGHVILHYNKGWNHGFHDDIRYWEVLNEPDGRFNPQKYYKLYGSIARAVKTADTSALIGGPALMFAYQGPSYREDFLQYLKSNDLPLDFWSFHDYCVDSADPYNFVRLAKDMRELLDSHGFARTQLILDEWNVLGINADLLTMAGRAAFTASAIIYMQDSPIDAQTFYMGPNLFGEDGKTTNKVGQALVALGRMKRTPVRLAVSGADTQGFAVQAGRSDDGTEINVLISNYEVPASLRGARKGGNKVAGFLNLLPRRELKYERNQGFDLSLTSLKPDQFYRIERYRINDVWDYRLLNTVTLKGSEVAIRGTLAAPGIELVVIKALAK
jgi:hypothetical protein